MDLLIWSGSDWTLNQIDSKHTPNHVSVWDTFHGKASLQKYVDPNPIKESFQCREYGLDLNWFPEIKKSN